MKKIVFTLFIISSFLLKAQDQPLLSYFYNLGYVNPSFVSENDIEVDINSTSFYNNIPLGIYSLGVYGSAKLNDNFGLSVLYNQTRMGKSQKMNKMQFYGQYFTEINLRHTLGFGLGIRSYTEVTDETKLISDLDLETYNYTYGETLEKQNSFQVPIGVSFKSKKIDVGIYYSQGVEVESTYGLYTKFLAFNTSINSYQAEDFIGLAIHKENWNTKLTVYNDFEFDNYKIDLFYDYNFTDVAKSYQSIGVSVHYNWKVFDLNYQLAINNNKLGMSHQIGMKIFY